MIGDEVEISIIEIRGDQVKIGVNAPKDVKVFRREVFDAIQAENRAAAGSAPTLPTLDIPPKK
jgi:carbon storage regulator